MYERERESNALRYGSCTENRWLVPGKTQKKKKTISNT